MISTRETLSVLAAALAFFGGAAYGQQRTATISGTSYDQLQAAIPNAKVEVKNEASGDLRKTTSNGSGFFTVTALQPGTYTVLVAAPGFDSWQQTGIALNQGDNRTLPSIALKVAGAATKVEVVSSADAVAPTDNGEVSTTLNAQLINSIPLQGRDAGEFLNIMPGMAMTNGLSNSSTFSDRTVGTNSGPVGAFSANGTQPNGAMAYMLDGANLVDPGNQGTQIANINGDMVAEVKVLFSSYGAEYAKGPVIFQAISKSGGSAFHGEAYLYARNSVFNAQDSFQKSQGIPKTSDFQYYPGGNVGGPVLIPGTKFNHNRQKLFFWFGYEYMRQQPAGQLWQTFVPTDQMRSGDFSPASLGSIASQATNRWNWLATSPCLAADNRGSCNGLSFPGGIIPQNQMDPNSLAMLKLYPKPNADPATHGGYNFQYLDQSPQNRWEQTEKIDYAISEKTKITVSYAYQKETDLHPVQVWWGPSFSLPYPSPLIAPTTANVVMTNATHVFSPTLTNETVFTYARYINSLTPTDPKAIDPATVGFNVPGLFGVKRVQIPNILSWSGNGGFAGFEQQAVFGGNFNGGAFGGLKSDPALYDNLTKVAGTHTMKFGFYWDGNANQQSSGNKLNGEYFFETYGGTTTGNIYGDLLTGRAQQYNQANAIPVDNMRYHQYSFYGQDSWRVKKRLTVNFGIRADHIGQWYGDGPGNAVFDLGAYLAKPTAVNAGLRWNAIDSSVPQSGFPSHFKFNPRFGAAYDVFGTGKMVLRGGFAIFPYQIAYNTTSGPEETPFGVINFSTNRGLTSMSDIANFNLPTGAPNSACGTGCSISPLAKGDGHVPYTRTFNFSIDYRLPYNMLFEANYVGNQSRDGLIAGGPFTNLNAIPLGAFFKPDPLTGVVNPITGNIPTGDYRPFQSYGDISVVGHGSYANYNSIQSSLQKQTGPVLLFLNYTFGKVLGIRDNYSGNGASAGNTVDPFNINNNYGVLSYDHTQIFNATYIVKLPSPAHGNAIVKGAVNGWQVSGTTRLQSGAPLQPNTNGNMNASYGSTVIDGSTVGVNTTTWLGTSAGNLALVPLVTCDPRSGLQSGQYFNPSCFTPPAQGHNGTLIWPYIHGPAFVSSDLAMFKTFKVTERQKLEFRFSAFNFLNHARSQFNTNGNGDVSLNFTAPNGSLSPTNTNAQTTGFPGYKVGDRLVTFAVKYYF
jgi:Carboxypeptidase regulatory-like domain/TonB-dependent Receptor Plug Domain